MKSTKKDKLAFIFAAILWGVIIGLGVIAGESKAHCTDEPPPEEYDYYIVYTV